MRLKLSFEDKVKILDKDENIGRNIALAEVMELNKNKKGKIKDNILHCMCIACDCYSDLYDNLCYDNDDTPDCMEERYCQSWLDILDYLNIDYDKLREKLDKMQDILKGGK